MDIIDLPRVKRPFAPMAHPLLVSQKMVVILRTVAYAAWLLAVIGGGVVVLRYENAAGQTGATEAIWPSNTKIPLSNNRPTLVMFAHPKCPCTRASIEELNRILARCSSKLSAHVLFFKPASVDSKWAHTDSWKSVSDIPGVIVSEDQDGEEARRFGAETSGYVVLYGADGNLLFKGGITSARGHVGDNAGVEQIVASLSRPKDQLQTPVYGCSLLGRCTTPSNQNN